MTFTTTRESAYPDYVIYSVSVGALEVGAVEKIGGRFYATAEDGSEPADGFDTLELASAAVEEMTRKMAEEDADYRESLNAEAS